jgi:hypothetical protein
MEIRLRCAWDRVKQLRARTRQRRSGFGQFAFPVPTIGIWTDDPLNRVVIVSAYELSWPNVVYCDQKCTPWLLRKVIGARPSGFV